jgi:alpha-tubulin suppressor-like RCC1 family protein
MKLDEGTNMKRIAMGIATLALALALLASYSSGPDTATAGTFAAVSTGENASCALVSSGGAVKCWGRNNEGELGIGTVSAPYTQSRVPVPVCASGAWNGTTCNGGSAFTGVYAISSGSNGSTNCGTVVYLILECWGNNMLGQVGNGTTTTPVVNPGVVLCQSTSGYCNSTYHFLAGIVAIATANNHTCALDNTGYVWCWGRNQIGQLGDGTTTSRSYATRVCATGSGQDCTNGTLLGGVTAIAAGEDFSCALLSSGGVKCWGFNYYGELGDGTYSNQSLPVDVSGLTSGVASLSSGQFHTCVVLAAGGAKCWGLNLDGELGDGTQMPRGTPVSVCASGIWNGTTCYGGSALSGVSKITAGAGHTCALMTSSPYVKCWGSEAFGQLGNSVQSYTGDALHPVSWTVPSWGQPQPTALSAGGLHTCAIVSTYVQCWGWNLFGQLGNNSTPDTATWTTQDTDKDGCTDAQELGPNHAVGGQRDPTNFWDFFDTPDANNVRDRKVDSADYNRVYARYLTSGSMAIDPLSQPPATGYHTAFDRQDDPNSSEAWDLIGPDGHITIADLLALNNQLNDSCQ